MMYRIIQVKQKNIKERVDHFENAAKKHQGKGRSLRKRCKETSRKASITAKIQQRNIKKRSITTKMQQRNIKESVVQ
ncbi:hypothetical protein DPMN_030286 [Dreissena polymorpha]|uniref:Uncharacterized protein n=1 Tax=Dreissena polymorpha TaxID=45954 RepID=A0A9D4M2C0_DREPO|nr:hypothetical protein DPMN_030286 [Dreissena polymorpha]